jgi:hypothetical protein
MVSVKEAAHSAIAFAGEILGDKRVDALLLEEIELSDDDTEWLVTVSIPTPRVPETGFGMLTNGGPAAEPRDYKLIRVDAETGLPVAIKIREV